MRTVQRLAFLVAIATTTVSIGLLNSSAVQAAIVSGTVTGTWNIGQPGMGVNLGDSFSAAYSYDDTAIIPLDNSQPGLYQQSGFEIDLLSFQVTTGSFSYTYDPNANLLTNYAKIFFSTLTRDPSGSWLYSAKSISLNTGYSDSSGSVFFSAYKSMGLNYSGTPFVDDGVPFSITNAGLTTINSMGQYTTSVISQDTALNPDPTATPIPTPALLPGLLGLGASIWRKRKQMANEAESCC
jgi:hypothetical protein